MSSIKDKFIESEKELENKVNRLCINLVYLLNEEEFKLESEITADYIRYDLERPIVELEEDEVYNINKPDTEKPDSKIVKISIIDKNNYYQIIIDYLDGELIKHQLSAIIKDKENEEVVNLINKILAKDQIEMNNIAIEAIDYMNRNLF